MRFLLNWLPKPTLQQVAAKVIAELHRRGTAPDSISYDGMGEIKVLGGHRLYVGHLHAECLHLWPWQRSRHIAGFLARVVDVPDVPDTFEGVRESLLPAVRDSFVFEVVKLQAELHDERYFATPGFPLGPRLKACLVVDFPESTRMVSEKDLETWGVSFDQAYAAALENLAARSAGGFGTAIPGVYHSTWSDCYDPARVLVPGKCASVPTKGAPLYFAPNWNVLLVTGEDDLEGVIGGLVAALQVTEEQPRPMSAIPFLRRDGGWLHWEIARGHFAEPLLRKVRVLEMLRIYEQQAELLNAIFKKRGEDIFVASYTGTHNKDQTSYSSQCMWAKGIVTLLPQAEAVMFYDNDQPDDAKVVARIDWDLVRLHCAPLMNDTDYVVPRFRVEEFPSEQALRAMRDAQAARDAANA